MTNNNEKAMEKRIIANIPEGYSFKEGSINTGIVIENDSHDQFVYVPSGYNTEGIYVPGFWISRYEISKGENEKPCSVAYKAPWVNINYSEAVEIAKSVDAELISGAEYGRICMWLVETKAATFEQIYVNGKKIENFVVDGTVAMTGSNLEWKHNNIFDFGGNCYIFTTEKSEISHRHRIARGGYGIDKYTGKPYPPAHRIWLTLEERRTNLGFRIVIRDIDEED